MKQAIFALIVLFSLNSFSQAKKDERKKDDDSNSKSVDEKGELDPKPDSPRFEAVIENPDEIYNAAGMEIKPEFPGGLEKMNAFLTDNFKVPEDLKNDVAPKKVFAMFIIEKDGSMTDIKILRDVGFGTGKEAIRVLKMMPKWSPGQQNGKKVRCLYSMPIVVNGK